MKYTKTIRASKNVRPARKVRASRESLQRKAIKADEDIELEDEIVDEPAPADEGADVYVDEAATELLFEAEDVAELIAEVTGAPVDVTVDDSEVVFAVGDDEYTVTPEGDEEIVEQSTRIRKSAESVKASKMPTRRVAATRRARK